MQMRSVAALAVLFVLPACLRGGASPDDHFDTTVSRPAFTGRHPVMLIDRGHHNAHTAAGGYRPFAGLMTNDGFLVRENGAAFTADVLAQADVLVIVNASGGSNPKLLGYNLEFLRRGERDAPAFRRDEIERVKRWVRDGGAMLLVADHYPFGAAAAPLAAAFGVTMSGGFTEVPAGFRGEKDPGAVLFTRENGLLGAHPILEGRSTSERVARLLSFTGQSLRADSTAVILRLPSGAVDFVPPPPNFSEAPAGNAQGVAFGYGRGRVVILGEAAMLTAQVAGGDRFGMNRGGLDNRQFALNIAHWLAGLL